MKITIFGDSIVRGFGIDSAQVADAGNSLLKRLILEQMPELDIQLFGMNGDDTYGALLRYKYVLAAGADLNFIFFGANDASPYVLVSPDEFSANLTKMITAFTPEKSVLITPPMYDDDNPTDYSSDAQVQRFRLSALTTAEATGAASIDFYEMMARTGQLKKLVRPIDGLHLTEAGYQLLADAIVDFLREKY